MLKGLMNDQITIRKKNGEEHTDIRAMVQKGMIFTNRADVPIEAGDEILRKTPAGVEEVYVVEDPGFFAKVAGIEAHYQISVRPAQQESKPSGAIIYNISGNNARFNIDSIDASTNVVQQDTGELFHSLREAIQAELAEESEYERLLEAVCDLEKAVGKREFPHKYAEFMSLAADHIAILGPFIPALTQLIGIG